jgi:hypothetical protein
MLLCDLGYIMPYMCWELTNSDAPNPNGTVSVLNRERVGSVNGHEDVINGWAEVCIMKCV